jgi:hypothetical protein
VCALRLTGLALALAVPPLSATHAQTAAPISPAAIVSAGQDCFDSFNSRKFELDEGALKKRGWKKAALADNNGLAEVMTPFVRADGTLMLSFRYSCMIKVNLAPGATRADVAAAISEHWAVQPTDAGDKQAWSTPAGGIEFPNGNGTMVDVIFHPGPIR